MEDKKQSRKPHSTTCRDKALKYYLLGLNLCEVSKLTEVPRKTLEKWQQKECWTKLRPLDNIKIKAANLKEQGFSNKQISEILNVSHTTVWRYCK